MMAFMSGKSKTRILDAYGHPGCEYLKKHIVVFHINGIVLWSMGMLMAMGMLLWVASLGFANVRASPKSKSKKIFFAHEAHSEQIVLLGGGNAVEANMIYGLVEVGTPHMFDFMERYTESTTLQLQFWQNILPNSDRYVFQVKHFCSLAQPVPLLQCSDRLLKGMIVSLEPGQAERLWGRLELPHHWVDMVCPTIAVRLPPQHAFLSSTGIFSNLVVPDAGKRVEKGGSKGLFIDWQMLGISKPSRPKSDSVQITKDLDFDKNVARDVGNVLKQFAENLDVTDDFDCIEYNHVVQLVRVMLDMQEQLDPVYFHKVCRDLQHRAAIVCADGSQRRKLKYKVMWLLQVLIMSDCLRQTGHLKKVILKSIELVVPPVLVNVFRDALTNAALAVPHKGTLSRWRLLLDGGFMLWQRAKNKAGTCLRWMMTDSSTQHGRSFQLTSLLSLHVESAAQALSYANELVLLWFLDSTYLFDYNDIFFGFD